MILAITYGDEKYKRAKKLNCKTAKKFGADRTIAYGPEDVDEDFKRKNRAIWDQPRGGGYWIWKPYLILKTLQELGENDYLIYTDAGTVYTDYISKLIECMEKYDQSIMAFSLGSRESSYTKRDVFLLLECDEPKYADSFQILGGYVLAKRTKQTEDFFRECLFWVQDPRAVTDQPNCLGKENYSDFVENRHDQSIFSLLCKKHGILPFRDPSQWGEKKDKYPQDVVERSDYPQIVFSHRNGNIGSMFQLKYGKRKWFKYTTWSYYRSLLSIVKGIIKKRYEKDKN